MKNGITAVTFPSCLTNFQEGHLYSLKFDGTAIFANENNGYTNPRVFTAATAGYVTVEVRTIDSSNSYNYQIYYSN
jgi:hypothetical protein